MTTQASLVKRSQPRRTAVSNRDLFINRGVSILATFHGSRRFSSFSPPASVSTSACSLRHRSGWRIVWWNRNWRTG